METIASIIPLSSALHPQEVCKWNSFRNHIWTSFCLSTPRLTTDGHKTLPTHRWVEVDCCSWGRPTSQGSLMQLCLCSSLLLLYGVTEPNCVWVNVRTCWSGWGNGYVFFHPVNQREPSIPWSLTSSFLFSRTFQSKIIIFLSPTLDSYSLLDSTIGEKTSSFHCPCIIPAYRPDQCISAFLSHGGMIEVISTWKHAE